MSILIRDTTKEQRERIVADSIGNIDGLCDGCSPGIIEMYQDYIDGKKELREINAGFQRGYTTSMAGMEKTSCDDR
ncbi:MAG: purine biosynthesis protein PurH [Clostridia bacterium]|nr:purine biosynthesis protein PurH [Clostridia bacterium]